MRFWGGGLPTACRHIIQPGQSILLKLLITPICIVSKPIQGLKPELFCALCSMKIGIFYLQKICQYLQLMRYWAQLATSTSRGARTPELKHYAASKFSFRFCNGHIFINFVETRFGHVLVFSKNPVGSGLRRPTL